METNEIIALGFKDKKDVERKQVVIMQTDEIYKKLYDKNIISDLKMIGEDEERFIFGVRRSKYKINIPKQITPEIAYLAGVIAGDGCFYFCKFKNRIYPRVRLTITSGDEFYLRLINDIFIESFGAGGQIHKDIRKQSCYTLLINHRVIWLYFRNVLKLDKRKLIVPSEVADRVLFKSFLAGFFDTDGYFSNGVFGSMIGNKNKDFLDQLVYLSAKFYSLEFNPVKVNKLLRDNKIFMRAYTTLKKRYSNKFLNLIPFRNTKYSLIRNYSGGSPSY